jgi:hypothetical protein
MRAQRRIPLEIVFFFNTSGVRAKKEIAMTLTEFLSRFDGGELIGLLALAGGMIVGTILGSMGILLGFYVQRQELRRAEIMAALKQDMLNRAMSAEEICIVLEAGSKSSGKALSSHLSCKA